VAIKKEKFETDSQFTTAGRWVIILRDRASAPSRRRYKFQRAPRFAQEQDGRTRNSGSPEVGSLEQLGYGVEAESGQNSERGGDSAWVAVELSAVIGRARALIRDSSDSARIFTHDVGYGPVARQRSLSHHAASRTASRQSAEPTPLRWGLQSLHRARATLFGPRPRACTGTPPFGCWQATAMGSPRSPQPEPRLDLR